MERQGLVMNGNAALNYVQNGNNFMVSRHNFAAMNGKATKTQLLKVLTLQCKVLMI